MWGYVIRFPDILGNNVSHNSGAETGAAAVAEVAITVADAVVTEAAAAAEGAGGATMMAEAEDTAEGRGKRYLILVYTISSITHFVLQGILHPRHHHICEGRGEGTCRRP